MWKELLTRYFELIFEMCILLIVFIVSSLFIAFFPSNQLLIGWVTGGAVIGALVRALYRTGENGNPPSNGSNGTDAKLPPNTQPK